MRPEISFLLHRYRHPRPASLVSPTLDPILLLADPNPTAIPTRLTVLILPLFDCIPICKTGTSLLPMRGFVP